MRARCFTARSNSATTVVQLRRKRTHKASLGRFRQFLLHIPRFDDGMKYGLPQISELHIMCCFTKSEKCLISVSESAHRKKHQRPAAPSTGGTLAATSTRTAGQALRYFQDED